MSEAAGRSLWNSVSPYLEKESLAAFFVGISSGFPFAMIGATLTTRLAQDGIDKKTVTAFTLAFLVYNLKVFWAWMVDGVRIPLLGRLISGNADAYQYLPESTQKFKTPDELAVLMREAGFRNVDYKRFMFGTMAVHWGEK